MFNFDWQKGGPWNESNIKGPQGWLQRCLGDCGGRRAGWTGRRPDAERDIERKLHQTIAVINRGLEEFSFNTAIAEQMKFKNSLKAALRGGGIGAQLWQSVMNQANDPLAGALRARISPRKSGRGWDGNTACMTQPWPQYDADKAREDMVDLVVMINGKPRETIDVAVDIAQGTSAGTGAGQRRRAAQPGGKAAEAKTIFVPGPQWQRSRW